MSMCTKCLGSKKVATEYRIDIPHFAQCPQCFGTGIEPGSLSKEPLVPGSIVDKVNVPTFDELHAQEKASCAEYDADVTELQRHYCEEQEKARALRRQDRRDSFARTALHAILISPLTNSSGDVVCRKAYEFADAMIAASGSDV